MKHHRIRKHSCPAPRGAPAPPKRPPVASDQVRAEAFRPTLTVAMDVATRAIVGFDLT